MKKGQIQIGLGVLAAGGFILASLTLAVNAYLKSGEVMNKVSAIEGDIKSIRSDINAINNKLNDLSDYFKLVPKSSGKINTK